MPVSVYRNDQLKRLSDIDYAAQYLKVALSKALASRDLNVFRLALKNVVDAQCKANRVDVSRHKK